MNQHTNTELLRPFPTRKDPSLCQWFALCDRKATTTTPHPILGGVPTCERCHEFASQGEHT